MDYINSNQFLFAIFFTILRTIVGQTTETITEFLRLPLKNETFINNLTSTTTASTLGTSNVPIFNNIHQENKDKFSPNLYTENIFLPLAPKNYHFDRTHESIATAQNKKNNYYKESPPLKKFNILDFNAYIVKPLTVNENIKDLIEKNKRLKKIEEPSGGLHVKTFNFVHNLRKTSVTSTSRPKFPPIDDYSKIWEFRDNIDYDTTEKPQTNTEAPKKPTKPINLVQVKLKLQRQNTKNNSEVIPTKRPPLINSSITIDGINIKLGENYGKKIKTAELFNPDNAQKLVQNANPQQILTKKSFDNTPSKQQYYNYAAKHKPFIKVNQNNQFVATTTEKSNFLIHVDDYEDNDYAHESDHQATQNPIKLKNNLSTQTPNYEKKLDNKRPTLNSHSNLDYSDLILSTKRFLSGTGIPFVTAPYYIKNKYGSKISPRGKYSSKYNANIKLPKYKLDSVLPTTIPAPFSGLKYAGELKKPIEYKSNGYEVSETKFEERRVKPDTAKIEEAVIDEQPGAPEIIKYFQDMITVQLSPTQLEFGHIMENPNGWEDRYERKDLDKLRFQGKVRWGDTIGGYGEHYWDLNHHKTN